MPKFNLIEYKIRRVERFIVTRYFEAEDGGGVSEKGEYDNENIAYEVASALANDEHRALGWDVGDERFLHPKRLDDAAQLVRLGRA